MDQTGEAKAEIAALGLDQISQRVSAGSSITGLIATGAPLNTTASSVATTIQSSVANSSKSPRLGEIPQQSSHPCLHTALPTPVNVAVLSRVLLGYNSRIAYRLIKGFSEGFKINYQGPRITTTAPNLGSAYENPDVVDDKLRKERELGRIAGPFDSPPFANLRISPLGVIPKKTPGEFRMIHHLSYPKGASINDSIPPEFSTVKYASVDDAISIIQRQGKGCAMAKTDVRSAFRIVPVHPSDYPLLGFQWKEKWYYDKTLPMGCSSSCQIFEDLSTAMEWVAQNKLQIQDIKHILDDFLIIDKSLDTCGEKLNRFLHFCHELGVPMAEEKTVGPAHVLTFAGIELDCLKHEARLPREKVEKCRQVITQFLSRKKVTLQELQSLIGLLNFACSIIKPGRVFLRRLINLTVGITRPTYFIRLTLEVKKDLRIWQQFLTSFNCQSIFLEEVWTSSGALSFYTDAAQSCGFGTIFGTHWTYGKWPDKWQLQDISVLELYPIMLGVHLWASRLKNKRVLFYSDNESVVHVINKQTSKHKGLLALVRQLVLICLSQNIYFKARHVPGRHNVLADSLSRLQVERFLSLTRGMDSLPTTIPPHLQPDNWEIP